MKYSERLGASASLPVNHLDVLELDPNSLLESRFMYVSWLMFASGFGLGWIDLFLP